MLRSYIQKINPSSAFALGLMAVILMMILPMPSWILDIGLAVSFALAILIFSTTLFVEKPTEFSSFPVILLSTLMLRLSLNISSTKLIIGEGHEGTHAAGSVIEGFANYIIGQNVFLGIVIFCVLLIVNFLVITNGATRMAEVGARFALDAMPGKQMAIDSELAAGAITQEDARHKREEEQMETSFYGSLDGASKFVKGDAVAGLLITLLNMFMGFIMGTVVHGMNAGTAFETYAILTIGDGLVSQVPSVIVSVASGILLSRGKNSEAVDRAIGRQLTQSAPALATVGIIMAVFAFVPGLPFIPFMLLSATIALIWYKLRDRLPSLEALHEDAQQDDEPSTEERAIELLDVDDIHIQFAPNLVGSVLEKSNAVETRIQKIRTYFAKRFGVLIPEIRLSDDHELAPFHYRILIYGISYAEGMFYPERLLVLNPEAIPHIGSRHDVKEPVFQTDATWVSHDALSDEDMLSDIRTIEPIEMLLTHLMEIIKQNLAQILTYKLLQSHLDDLTKLQNQTRAEANRRLFQDIIPDKVPVELLLQVLKALLEENVPVRNIPLILEALAESRGGEQQFDELVERVRKKIALQIASEYRAEGGELSIYQIDNAWIDALGNGTQAPDSDDLNTLITQLSEAKHKILDIGEAVPLVVPGHLRKLISSISKMAGVELPVLSFDEIRGERNVKLVGVIAR